MTRVITQKGNNINYMSMATTDFTNNHLMTPELQATFTGHELYS
ncbi:MAG: hypothetical protein E7K36_18805 [Bacteroides sp.]|nr:hypothetical protein [Phocaeicola vulgatus]MDU7570513.1 hypothetical protein [Bacteroides sp.]